jgi:hypothetical protein
VKNRFQSLPFKCSLQRYNKGAMVKEAQEDFERRSAMQAKQAALFAVGLCTLNQVDP